MKNKHICRHKDPGDFVLVSLREREMGKMRAQIDCEVCEWAYFVDVDARIGRIIKQIVLKEK